MPQSRFDFETELTGVLGDFYDRVKRGRETTPPPTAPKIHSETITLDGDRAQQFIQEQQHRYNVRKTPNSNAIP